LIITQKYIAWIYQNNPPTKGAFQMLDGEKKLIVEGNLSLFI
jgi:hypothetical protein